MSDTQRPQDNSIPVAATPQPQREKRAVRLRNKQQDNPKPFYKQEIVPPTPIEANKEPNTTAEKEVAPEKNPQTTQAKTENQVT